MTGTSSRNLVRRAPQAKTLPPPEAKKLVLELLSQGSRITDAMRAVQRSYETYKEWTRSDPEFAGEVRHLRALAERAAAEGGPDGAPVPDFPEFCRDYLRQPLYAHQLRMWDLICGRAPRDLHPSMTYRPGRLSRLLINVPPDHAKTTSISINYVTWLIHRNPDIKVVIVSKTQAMAKKMLGAIKFRLTDASFRPMHVRFAPQGGWKDPDQSWTMSEIYVKGRGTSGEKDPTVSAIGMSGHIQGARTDIMILDDVVDRGNASAWEDQADWLAQIVTSRLPDDDDEIVRPDDPGKLIILGTRNAPIELYQKLRDEFTDYDGNPVYSYLAQPAVLEYGERPEDWVTLWPSTIDGRGTSRRKWNGPALAKRRGDVRSEALWALTFQQQDVAENATFPADAVTAAISGRQVGLIPEEGAGATRGDKGMRGLYVVAGLDPATVGCTAMTVMGVDRLNRRRHVLEVINKSAMSPHELRQAVKSLTLKYHIQEWRVETNAFQRYLQQDEELKAWLANVGCTLKGHYTTGKNKWDPDYGVASLAALFLSCVSPDDTGRLRRIPGGGLIELPSLHRAQSIVDMVDQFVTWQPEQVRGVRTDIVMSMWFAEIAAREYLGVDSSRQSSHLDDPFLSRHDAGKRQVIDLNALAEAIYAAA